MAAVGDFPAVRRVGTNGSFQVIKDVGFWCESAEATASPPHTFRLDICQIESGRDTQKLVTQNIL